MRAFMVPGWLPVVLEAIIGYGVMPMRRLAAVAVAMAVVGCSRCGGSSAPDAAVAPAPVGASASRHRSTDLRTALMMLYPEYRATTIVRSQVQLTRTLNGSVDDLLKGLAPALTEKGFTAEATADGFTAKRAEFTLEGRKSPAGAVLTLLLPIKEQDVGRAMMAPASISSDSMAQLIPDVPGTTLSHEDYELTLVWQGAYEQRPQFLLRQLIGGAVAVGWKPNEALPFALDEKLADGGAAPVPDPLDVTLVEPSERGARIAIHREGLQTTLRYLLRTQEP